jgi:3,4-dihydroxy 2-butanone 4-phosphate synthase/GTP cyclohydrolase II
MGLIEDLSVLAEQTSRQTGKPLVILCYAQSLDGSITARRGQPLVLSGEDSFRYVHMLRAACDGILVGIGTVLADDPQLNVRLVNGPHPQPIILDSSLRFPLSARLLQRPGPHPWIFAAESASNQREAELERAGARVFRLPLGPENSLDLHSLLNCLYQLDIHSLMVEGGARVISSFLQARLADYLVMTLVPVFVGGLHALEQPLFENHHTAPPETTHGLPRLLQAQYELQGPDLVITGRLA